LEKNKKIISEESMTMGELFQFSGSSEMESPWGPILENNGMPLSIEKKAYL
jgi:hypothetical protein